MAMTKETMAAAIHTEVGYARSRSVELIESVLEIMKRTLERGEDVLISGFGKLSVNQKHERRGRNPQNCDPVMLPARSVVGFKASRILKESVNGSERDD